MEGLEKNTENEQQENAQHKVDMEGQTAAEDVTADSAVEEMSGDLGAEESDGAGDTDTSRDEVNAEEGHASESKQEALMEMYEESLRRVQVGEVVQGKIVQVDKEYVLIDIGSKSEGQVPIGEFKKADGTIDATVGDTVDVMVDRWEDEDGTVKVSKDKASRVKIWDDIKKTYEKTEKIRGQENILCQKKK